MKFSRLGPNIAPPVMRAQPGSTPAHSAPGVIASVTYLSVPFAGVSASWVTFYPTPFAGVDASIMYNIAVPFAGIDASITQYTPPFAGVGASVITYPYPFSGVDAAGLSQYTVPFESTNH